MSYVKDMLGPDEDIAYQAATSWIAYISAIAVLAVMLQPTGMMRLANTELALTNKRVIGKTGILGRKSIAVKLADIANIHIRRGPLGWLLDYGSITVNAKDGRSVTFKGILWPLIFEQEANEAIEVAVLGRKLSDYAPDF